MENGSDVLEVIRMGHPTLSKFAEPVADPRSNEVRQVIKKMHRACMLESSNMKLII